MKVGDVLEVGSAVAVTGAAWAWQHSVALTLLSAAIALAWFAQLYADHEIARPRLRVRWPRRRKAAGQ